MAMTLIEVGALAPERLRDTGMIAPLVIKVGGSTLGSDTTALLREIVALHDMGQSVVVVHGGGPIINDWLTRLGVMPQFSGGRRVTDAVTLDVARAVLSGVVNGDLVRAIVTLGGRAVGLSGLDGGMVHARLAEQALGFVGLIESIDPSVALALCRAGCIPVISPISLGPNGECLNVNADDVALAIAMALRARALVFASDVPGVHDAQGQQLPRLSASRARELIASGAITGGMIPKMEACLAALSQVSRIAIVDAAAPNRLSRALSDECPGTLIECD